LPIEPGTKAGASSAAIELVDVHKSFGSKWVLRGVSFSVPADRITVLIGESGAGKTTCLRLLLALDVPDAGKIVVEGRQLGAMRRDELAALRRRGGVMLQGSGIYGGALFESLTVFDNVCYQLRELTDMSEDLVRDRAHQRLAEVGMADHLEAVPAELSAGMRKRVALARAWAADPDFVILDGFELGIDGVRRVRLAEVLRQRQRSAGGTYLVVTQDMDVARRLADHVAVLAEGRILAQGPADDVLGSDDQTVRQLVHGLREGPIRLADLPPVDRPPPAPPPPSAQIYDFPLWLAAVALLVAITASAAGNGGELLVVVAIFWLVAALVGIALVRRSRR